MLIGRHTRSSRVHTTGTSRSPILRSAPGAPDSCSAKLDGRFARLHLADPPGLDPDAVQRSDDVVDRVARYGGEQATGGLWVDGQRDGLWADTVIHGQGRRKKRSKRGVKPI